MFHTHTHTLAEHRIPDEKSISYKNVKALFHGLLTFNGAISNAILPNTLPNKYLVL